MKQLLLTALATALLTAMLLAAGALYAVGALLVDLTLRREADGQPPTVYRVIIEGSGRRIRPAARPAFAGEPRSQDSFDGLALRATRFAPNGDDGHRWAIIVHGYGLSQAYMWNFADEYLRHGYSVLTPDLRASGSSDGRYLGMGALDRRDLRQWIAHIRQGDPQARIVLHGVSLGAAAVLLAAADNPPGVVAVVADSAYTTLRSIMALELRRLLRVPDWPLLDVADFVCRRRAGFAFAEADPLAAVRAMSLPVLFVHSETDLLVPPAMSGELCAACSSPAKSRLLVRDCGHAVAFQDPAYFARVLAFADRWTR